MPTALLELVDRIITDTGDVVLKHEALLRMARDGLDFHAHATIDCPEVRKYNKISRNKLTIYADDGEAEGPPEASYEWTTPEPYRSMNVLAHCQLRLKEMGLDDETYRARLEEELDGFHRRGMVPVLRQICHLVADFRARGVVWGVGRGSSCASLVLYLCGLNSVDPIRYSIPLEEFLR